VQSIPNVPNKRILEVGCGTGAFTKEILKTLGDGDEFHIVELSKEFCDAIESSLLIQFRNDNPKISVVLHNAPIEEAIIEGQFDAIICGLPFNNFPVKLVQHLFDVMFGFLKPNCELAYFEYLGMRGIKRLFGFPNIRRETKVRTIDIETRYVKQQGTQETVWRNIPSCRVVRLRA
jgi:phosphatidylethanolamine/phosphatidyl-N-methylethanolamine N-methyltransferase